MAISLIDAIFLVISLLILGIIFFLIYFYFHHSKRNAKTVDFQLKNWIKKAREIGHGEREMEESLIKHGWEKEMVKRALRDTKAKFY